jgi:hypothetical protein
LLDFKESTPSGAAAASGIALHTKKQPCPLMLQKIQNAHFLSA